MSEEYTHRLLRMVAGRICQPLGWQTIHSSACDVLVDIMKHYMFTVAKTTCDYSCHANRTEPNLKDLAQAFADLGIDVAELSEFCREVESTKPTQAIPKYPLPRKSTHVNLSTTSRVVARKQISRSSRSSSTSSDEEEIIPCYLPPLPSKHSEKEDDRESGIQDGSDKDDEALEISGRRPSSDSEGLFSQQFRTKRFSSDISEEGNVGSRRSSLSEAIPPVIRPSSAESASVRTPEIRAGTSEGILTVAGPPAVQSVQVGSHKSADTTVLKNVVVTPLPVQRNIFEMAFARKLAETRPQTQLEFQAKSAPLTTKRPQLPPLRLMNPITEPVSVFSAQQPPLSPILRSQGGAVRTCRLPILSPLRTPTPTRAPRPVVQLHGSGGPVVSPPWKEVTPSANREQIISPPQAIPISPITAHPSSALVSPIRAPQPTSLIPQMRSGGAVSVSTTTPQPIQASPLTTTAPQPIESSPPATTAPQPIQAALLATTSPLASPLSTTAPQPTQATQPEFQPSTPPKLPSPPHPPVTQSPITYLPVASSLVMKQMPDIPISAVENPELEAERKSSQPEIIPVPVIPPTVPQKQLRVAVENSPPSSPPSVGSSPSSREAELSPPSSSEHEPMSPKQARQFGEPALRDTLDIETGVISEAAELHVGRPGHREVGDGLKTVTQVEHSSPNIETEMKMSTISQEVPRLSPIAVKEPVSSALEEKLRDSRQSGLEESSEESDESEDEESSGSEAEPQEEEKTGERVAMVEERRVVVEGRGVVVEGGEDEEEMGMEVEDVPLLVSWPKQLVPSLKTRDKQTPTLLTKAEMKSELTVPSGLSVTSGPVTSVPSLVAPPLPESPSPTDVEPPQPLFVSVSRRVLRHSKLGLPVLTPTEERVKMGSSSSTERVKLRLASFGMHRVNILPTPSEERVMATPSPTPPPPSRKRELDITEVGLLGTASKKVKSETQLMVISQPSPSSSSSSSYSSSDDDDSESGSPVPSPSPPPSHPHTLPVRPTSLWQQQEEEDTPSPAPSPTPSPTPSSSPAPTPSPTPSPTHSGGGLKLRLKIPKSLIQPPASVDSGPTKSGRKLQKKVPKATPALVPMVTVQSSAPKPADLFGVKQQKRTMEVDGVGGTRRGGESGTRRGVGGRGAPKRGMASGRVAKRGVEGAVSQRGAGRSVSRRGVEGGGVPRRGGGGEPRRGGESRSAPRRGVEGGSELRRGGESRSAPRRGLEDGGVSRRGVESRGVEKSDSGLIITSSEPTIVSTIQPPKPNPDLYICPLCLKPDDGSPMIGCDGCDSWIHWHCAGITRAPPEDEKWYCPTCSKRTSKAKKKPKKKKR